ncbi:MAG: DUF2269 family protein [Polyangiaceae bacterium]|jgi:uncharacterized membrane protein|nr:DUF2269 family protein [Polyangiaceae bacterium]
MLLQLLLFLHVMGTVIWVGGFAMHLSLMRLLRKEGPPEQRVKLMRYDDQLSTTVHIPAGLTVLATGIVMVLKGGISWLEPWIIVGLVGWLIASLVGALFYVPNGKKLEEAIKAEGAGSAAARRYVERAVLVTRLDFYLLVFVIFSMVTRLNF